MTTTQHLTGGAGTGSSDDGTNNGGVGAAKCASSSPKSAGIWGAAATIRVMTCGYAFQRSPPNGPKTSASSSIRRPAMPERPIIMSGASVRATMAGLKTQFRRVMPKRLFDWWNACGLEIGDDGWPMVEDDHGNECRLPSPYEVGDALWVRETFQPIFADGFKHGKQPYPDWKTGYGYAPRYLATEERRVEWIDGDDNITERCIPSIHMPRWASRLSLLVTEVRAQRLQEISEEDAMAEGVMPQYAVDCVRGEHAFTARPLFQAHWDRINGKKHPWSRNDWVFAYTFERQERSGR